MCTNAIPLYPPNQTKYFSFFNLKHNKITSAHISISHSALTAHQAASFSVK